MTKLVKAYEIPVVFKVFMSHTELKTGMQKYLENPGTVNQARIFRQMRRFEEYRNRFSGFYLLDGEKVQQDHYDLEKLTQRQVERIFRYEHKPIEGDLMLPEEIIDLSSLLEKDLGLVRFSGNGKEARTVFERNRYLWKQPFSIRGLRLDGFGKETVINWALSGIYESIQGQPKPR